MKKKVFILIFLSFFFSSGVDAESGDIQELNLEVPLENNANIVSKLSEEDSPDVQLQEAQSSTTQTQNVGDILGEKKKDLEKILQTSAEEQDVQYVENLLKELEIKKEVNTSFLNQIQDELTKMQEKFDENDRKIQDYELLKSENLEIKHEIESLTKKNQSLKQDIYLKEDLIEDLKGTIDSYNLLEVKYNNLLASYVDVRKTQDNTQLKEVKDKLQIFYIACIIFLLAYIMKLALVNITKDRPLLSEKFFAYYDLFYGLAIITFVIIYLFFVFPQLYILLVFVSGSIIWANAILISSCVSSIIIFRKFTIGDIIKIDGEMGKIIRISPLHTTIRIINEHGILERDETSIPNINLIKDTVNIIKDIKEKDHHFSIILPLKDTESIGSVVESIKTNILLKYLKVRPTSINRYDNDIFKSKYEQTDAENITVHFYWIGGDEMNRKIEREMIEYLRDRIVTSKK